MTDPAAVAEIASDLITGPEIDFRPKTYEHGSYRFNRLLPTQGPLNVPLSTTNVTTTNLELPAKVFNLAKSVLRFQLSIPTQIATNDYTAGQVSGVCVHADTVPVIDRLSLYTRSGVYLADLTNFNTFMKVTNKWTQSKKELEENSIGEMSDWAANPVNRTVTNGFQISDAPAANLPQKAASGTFKQAYDAAGTGGVVDTVTVLPSVVTPLTVATPARASREIASGLNRTLQHVSYRFKGNQQPQALNAYGTVNQTEQRYLFQVGRANLTGAGNADRYTTLNYVVKFGQIPHSIFSVNKDLYFGETLILQINWAPTNRIGFRSALFRTLVETDAVVGIDQELHPASTYLGYTPDDNSGAVGAAPASAILNASFTSGGTTRYVTVNDVAVYLAVETNRALIETIVRQMSSAGLRLLVPYALVSKFTSTAGVTQNVQQRINRAWGRTLLRIYHSVFNATETEIHSYDNYNRGGGSTVANFYTTLDNDRLQELNVDVTAGDDYLFLQELIKGTAIQSQSHLQDNWTWVDDWTGQSPAHYRKTDIGECGLTLAQERLWQIYCNMSAANSYNHYSIFITQKMLTITPAQISII